MLTKLFEKVNSELLTDEVKLELSTIFESQLNEAIAAKEQELEESNGVEITEFKDEMITKLDEYLTYFVEEFTKEQEDQIVEAVKVERASEILGLFDGMVQKFNIQLSDETFEESTELDEAKQKLSENCETILGIRKELEKLKVEKVIETKALEFSIDTEQEKFRKLAETVSYEGDTEMFAAKLVIIAESVKDSSSDDNTRRLEEEEDQGAGEGEQLDESEGNTSSTQRYMKYL